MLSTHEIYFVTMKIIDNVYGYKKNRQKQKVRLFNKLPEGK